METVVNSMNKVAFVLGGTGFIGSAVMQKLLARGRTVLTTTRSPSRDAFMKLLARRGADLKLVHRCVESRQLRVIYKFDLGDPGLEQVGTWYRALSEVGLRRQEIGVVINLVTDTSATNRGILKANLPRTANVVRFVKTLRAAGCADLLYLSMGSVAEKANVLRSPYARAKRKVRRLLAQEQASDFHVIAGLVKGRGDYNLPKAAKNLVKTMWRFPLWHNSFKLSVIPVGDLADMILHLESSSGLLKEQASLGRANPVLPIEVNVTGGELTFKDVLESLVDDELAKDLEQPPRLPFALEVLYLFAYWMINRTFCSWHQVRVRLANFALLGALAGWPALQLLINHHLTVSTLAKVYKMLDLPEAEQIELDPNLLCVLLRDESRIFMVRPRSVEELKAIVSEGRLRNAEAKPLAEGDTEVEACEMTLAIR